MNKLAPSIVDHLGKPIEVYRSDALALLVLDAVRNRQQFSITRMSDGEERILSYCKRLPHKALMRQFEEEWRVRFGVEGITCGEMETRLSLAAVNCTLFSPDGSEEFFLKHFHQRTPFAEIYFPHRWTRAERVAMLQEAGHVLVINRDHAVAERIRNSPHNPGCHTSWLSLSDWRESESVIERATTMCRTNKIPLVFCSCGPASKYIVGEIARHANTVALDMGSGAPHFWCTSTEQTCGSVKHCGAVAKEQ